MRKQTQFAMGMTMILTVVACTLVPRNVSAMETSTTSIDSNRSGKKIGLYTGVLNEPSPSLLSLNAAYNVTDYMRATVGIGKISVSGLSFDGSPAPEASATTIGAGAKFMIPGWSLTPTAGVHAATLIYSGTEGMLSIGGFEKSGSHVYVSAGIDYQGANGFNFGVGINQSLRSGIGSSTYLNLGWFFDWLS